MSGAFEAVAVRRIDASRLFVLEDGEPLERLRGLGDEYDAVAYEYKGDWHLLTISELGELRLDRKPTLKMERVFGRRTRVKTVPIGTKPSQAAIVVNAAGSVSGAWLAEPVIEEVRKAGTKRSQTGGSGPLRGLRSPRRREAPPAGLARAPLPPSAAAPEAAPPAPVGNGNSGRGGGGEGATRPEGGPDAPGIDTISRTPHLDAPKEVAKEPGTELTVHVYVDEKELRVGESGEGIELDLPADVDSIEVGVHLGLTGPFELVEGSEYRTLTIARDEEESAKLDFKLRVIPVKKPGPAVISALFTLRGRVCGQIARAWDWDAAGDKAPSIDSEAEAPVSMPLHIAAEQPSLSIIISAPAGGTDYRVSVQAPALKGYERPSDLKKFTLPPEAANFRKDLLKALTEESDTPEERFFALKRIGNEAWEAAPQIVKDVLWEMIDKKVPPTTINIATVEPILPWELMIPRRFDGKQPEELGPLGVEFAIGRWTRADGQAPSANLRVDRSFVIAPTYPKGMRLDFKAELNLVKSKLHGVHVNPATAKDLDQRFDKEQATLLHFVCHGTAGKGNDDAIALDGGKLMGAGEMESRNGFKALCRAKHPLVFLNSCSTGQMVPSLAGGAGFPKSFGNIGANAIIAPLWSVADKLASEIAVELYEEALKPDAKSLPAILQDIRRRGYEKEDADTYAAYCFFGDPYARLELV
jgi:CHAT domain